MSGGFWAWVAGPWGTLALTGGGVVFGFVLGMLEGLHRAERRAEEAAEDEHYARLEAMAARTHPVYRRALPPPEVAHEWQAHTETALALASPDPTVSAWTQQMAESMDAWLAEHVYNVPYSADELWRQP